MVNFEEAASSYEYISKQDRSFMTNLQKSELLIEFMKETNKVINKPIDVLKDAIINFNDAKWEYKGANNFKYRPDTTITLELILEGTYRVSYVLYCWSTGTTEITYDPSKVNILADRLSLGRKVLDVKTKTKQLKTITTKEIWNGIVVNIHQQYEQ